MPYPGLLDDFSTFEITAVVIGAVILAGLIVFAVGVAKAPTMRDDGTIVKPDDQRTP